MTIETLEILVTANMVNVAKEMAKIMPTVQKAVNQLNEKIDKIDMKPVRAKVNQAKKEMAKLSEGSGKITIQINGKQFTNQIKGYKQTYGKFIKDLNSMKINPAEAYDKQARNAYEKSGKNYNAPLNAMNYEQLANRVMNKNQNTVKDTAQIQENMTKWQALKGLIEQAKTGVQNYFNAMKNGNGLGSKLLNAFSKIPSAVNRAVSTFSKLAGIVSNIKNKITGINKGSSNIGAGFKRGLSHVLKYAGALIGLRSIYMTLRASANAWLSSQNAGAQQLKANIDYLKYAMGSALSPIIQSLTNFIYELMRAIQSVVYALTGVNIFAKATASSMKSASGSAKQAKKDMQQLAGVHDEINNITDNDNSGDSGGGAGAVAPSMDLSKLDNTPNSIIEALKNGEWYEVGEIVAEKLNETLEGIPWDKIKEKAKQIGEGIALLLNGFIENANWELVGGTIAQGLNSALYIVQNFLNTFNFDEWGKSIGARINGLFKGFDWKALGDTLSGAIKGVLDTVKGFIQEFDWSTLLEGLWNFILGIDWNGIADSIFELLGSACASLVNLGMIIGNYIKQAFNGIERYFQSKIEECGGNVVLGILIGIGDAVIGIGKWIYEHIFKPFIDGFKNVFGIHSPSTVMEEQGKFIMEGLLNGIKSLVGAVKTIWEGMKQAIKTIFEAIKTFITNVWNEIKDVTTIILNAIKNFITMWLDFIKNYCTTMFNAIKTIITTIWNAIQQYFTTLFNTIRTIIVTIWDGIKAYYSTLFNAMKTITTTIWDTIKNTISNVINGISNTISNVFNGIKNTISSIWDSVFSKVSNIWDSIKNKVADGAWSAWCAITNIFGGISDWFEYKFSNAWQRVKDVFSQGGAIFEGIKDGILNGLKSIVNAIIGGINRVIKVPFDGLNSALRRIRNANIAGIYPFSWLPSVSVPQIPQLAKGGVLFDKTIVMAGEYSGARTNPEIVTPQNILKDTVNEVFSAHEENGNNRPINIQLIVGAQNLGNILIDNLKERVRRTGNGLDVIVEGG